MVYIDLRTRFEALSPLDSNALTTSSNMPTPVRSERKLLTTAFSQDWIDDPSASGSVPFGEKFRALSSLNSNALVTYSNMPTPEKGQIKKTTRHRVQC